jgi:hypothetical protein
MQNSMSKKTSNFMKKPLKKGAQITAWTLQKSMPKLVTKRIRKIIKNHVSLKGKIIGINWKNNCFWWLKVACANGKGINKTSKMTPKSIRKSMKNRYKKHARKRHAEIMKKHQQVTQKGKWNQ